MFASLYKYRSEEIMTMNNIITTKDIDMNIKVIDDNLIFNEYHAEYHRNNNQNKISYIVTHDDGNEQYISCLLLNINIFDYLGFNQDAFSTCYLEEFDLFHYNGFLGIHYYGVNDKQNLKKFFEKYGKFFIKDFKPYETRIIKELEDRVIELHNEILNQIKIRHKLNELFWDR